MFESDYLIEVVVFLSTDEDNHDGQQQATSSNPMDTLYRDVLSAERQQASLQDWEEEPSQVSTHRTVSDQSQTSQTENGQSEDRTENLSAPKDENRRSSDPPESGGDASEQQHKQEPTRPAPPTEIKINQPIGSLDGAAKAGSVGLLTLRGKIETITDEEILQNRESEDGIRSIQRFRSYQPGKPSKVWTATPGGHKHRLSVKMDVTSALPPRISRIWANKYRKVNIHLNVLNKS